MKRALITGITGQDGSYLAELLLDKGYEVYGLIRRSSTLNFERISHIQDKVNFLSGDLCDQSSLVEAIKVSMPDEVYNLAAQSFVQTSWSQPVFTGDVTGLGVTRLLDAIKHVKPHTKFYQASSSEMFGKVREVPQTEKTPFYPRSPYGVAKIYGHWITVNYRESYGMFNCSGILFNHESPRRGREFVTRKITYTVARIVNDLEDKLVLGNLNSIRDWGFAGDYVSAMWLMLQQENPDDYVISSNETHIVREFLELAFKIAGIQDIIWKGEGLEEKALDGKTGKVLVVVSDKYYRPAEVDILKGNSEKARKKLGWKPEYSFVKLVELMMESDINLVKKWKD